MGLFLGLNNLDIYFHISAKALYKWKRRLIEKIEWGNSERAILTTCKANWQALGCTDIYPNLLIYGPSGSLLLYLSWEMLENKEKAHPGGAAGIAPWRIIKLSPLLRPLLSPNPFVDCYTAGHPICDGHPPSLPMSFSLSDCALRARRFHPWPSSLRMLYSPGAIGPLWGEADFALQGTCDNMWRHFRLSQLEGCAPGIPWVEAKDAKFPTCKRQPSHNKELHRPKCQ